MLFRVAVASKPPNTGAVSSLQMCSIARGHSSSGAPGDCSGLWGWDESEKTLQIVGYGYLTYGLVGQILSINTRCLYYQCKLLAGVVSLLLLVAFQQSSRKFT